MQKRAQFAHRRARLSERRARLSEDQRASLEKRLRGQVTDVPQDGAIPRRPDRGPAPLSFAQQRLWFLEQLEPGNASYNLPAAVRLAGSLNVELVQQSLNHVIRRHATLRTTFATLEGRPVQLVAADARVVLPVVDLEHFSQAERQVQHLMTRDTQRPFDLTRGPLLRAMLLRLAPREHVLFLNMHHIISDGWSIGVLIREMVEFYRALSRGGASPLPELPIQYADFGVWQREWLQGDVLQTQLSYWTRQLGDSPPVLELPTDRTRPPMQSFRGAIRTFALAPNLTQALKDLGQVERVTLFMTLLAAFKVLLYRYTSQTDISVGSPVANRRRPEIEGLIGFFVNTLVLRTDLSENPTFRELLGRVRDVTLSAYAHQDLPFEMLVEALRPERNLSHPPLFQVMFALQNAQNTPLPALELPNLTLSGLDVDVRTAKFDLTLFMAETPNGLKGMFEYNTDLFEAATIRRMMAHFQHLLSSLVADPDRRLSEVALLTSDEREQLLQAWNDTRRVYPARACLYEQFERQADHQPDAVAVVFADNQLTYQDLNRRANQLAHHLRELGVGPETLVCVSLERSPDMIVALLGVLKAGGAYVPLDPRYPSERTAFMLQDTQAPVLLTQQSLVERLPTRNATLVCLDADWQKIARSSEKNPVPAASSRNLAYVIYTSGSTGRPKGVAIEHRSAVALVHWARSRFGDALFNGTLASTSICFDLAVFELFVTLSAGGMVILVEDVLQVPALPAAGRVTLINTVPSAMAELLRLGLLPPSVRTVNLAGEPLPSRLADEIYRCEGVRQVFDLYGPSEDTTYSTCALRSAAGPETIGRPIENAQLYLLDAHLNPVPVGVIGELYLGGDGLARGYLNRPGLTAEAFVPQPFAPPALWASRSAVERKEGGKRLYLTGDLARYRPDGNVEFLGRVDHQVKLRGFRIELGEIETALRSHPVVREAVVVAVLASHKDALRDKRLVAYVVPEEAEITAKDEPTFQRETTPHSSLRVDQLRSFLKEKLPDYMIPALFVTLEALPRTPNGKVDRHALPPPERTRPELEAVYLAPRTPIEAQMAAIMSQVLGLERVGAGDDFFVLGGHSLLATQLVSRIDDAFQVTMPLRTVFEGPTVAELAAWVVDRQLRGVESDGLAQIVAQVDGLSEAEAASQLFEAET